MIENEVSREEGLRLLYGSKRRGQRKPAIDIQCADCGEQAPRRGQTQLYCEPCAGKRHKERQRRWAAKHHPTSEYVSRRESRKRARLKVVGSIHADKDRMTTDDLFVGSQPTAWSVRLSVPFSYASSKNHAFSFRGDGVVALRRETKQFRFAIAAAVANAVAGLPVVQAKLWLDLIIQKPNHRGDGINVLDILADAIKDGLGVDDRWFSIRRLDWQIIKRDPDILIGLGQDDTEDCRVCSYCGRVFPLRLFVRNRGMPGGYSRSCLECGRSGGAPRMAKLNPEKVKAIRLIYGTKATREIAQEFGVSQNTINAICRRHTWKEVE